MTSLKKGHGWQHRPKRHTLFLGSGFKRFIKPHAKGLFSLALILMTFAGVSLLVGSFLIIQSLPDPNALTQRQISQTTKIYDRTGEHLLYEIFGDENRTLVKIQEGFCRDNPQMELDPEGIPLFALQATITAEDRKFCQHGGFDVKGLARAVWLNLRGQRVGGSTLTQQLVKNAILSNEKTFTRKFKELLLSVGLERRYSKDEILQIYFNEIPYGSTYYGIQAASLNYYNKPINEINLAQAATLAALPKAPSTYLNNPDRLRERRDYILSEMQTLGFITEEEKHAATQENTDILLRVGNINAPHFVFYVKDLLEERFSPRQVEEGGLRVITSLDWEKQQIAERVVKEGVDTKGAALGFSNAALVAMDPKTGELLSMVGSKDYFDETIDGQVNVTTRLRQPGSSFKPIVFTRAFERGYTPNTVLWDVATTFPTPTGNYQPNNYDLSERGPIRLRQALQGSLNIPAVKLLHLVGVDDALNFAKRLGYTSFEDRSRFGLAVVLGGGEVKLVEHTSAYGAFANEGVLQEAVSILRVEDNKGDMLFEWKPTQGKRAIDQNAARSITNVLSDNAARAYVFGLSSPLQLGGRPVAAKTGTTNNARDAWTLGYTPSLVAGVWAGNNNNETMTRGAGGSSAAAPIWQAFMKEALANTPIETFNAPSIPTTGKAMIDGELDAQIITIDTVSGKRATEFTPLSKRAEKQFANYHTILHYVDPSDPLGPVPEESKRDAQYASWEAGVQQWITKRQEETGINVSLEEPPTEDDDVHIPANFPTVEITSPGGNTRLDSRTLSVSVNASAPRGISRVEFYLDSYFLSVDTSFPYAFDGVIPNTIARGFHTIKAIAYDDIENAGTDTVGIHVDAPESSISLSLTDPIHGQVIERTDNEFVVVVSVSNQTSIERVSVFASPLGSVTKEVIGSLSPPTSPFLTFPWTLPASGEWVLTATARTQSGELVETPGVIVRIADREKSVHSNENSETLDVPATQNPLDPFAR